VSAVDAPEIRAVMEPDVGAVVALVRSVLADYGLTFGEGSETDAQLTTLPASYTDAGGAFWVALLGGAIVGTVGVYPVSDGVLELRKMYLLRDARGRGIGQRLLDVATAFASARGARALVLDTTEQMKDARALYERNGFVRDDTQVRGARCSRGYRKDLEPVAGRDVEPHIAR
jgi:putative acetyltransferase